MKFVMQGACLALVCAGLAASPSLSANALEARPGSAAGKAAARYERTPGFVDSRQLQRDAVVRAERTQLRRQTSAAATYVRSLGPQATVELDPLTGTPRMLGRWDGYLSAPSAEPAREAALSFVRSHLGVLGLSAADLSTLRLRSAYADDFGIHHLSWEQVVGGTPVYGNGLKVNVTRDGRVLSVTGSPVSGLQRLADAAPGSLELTASSARAAAAQDVGGAVAPARVSRTVNGSAASTHWSNHDFAKRVWFLTPSGLRPGWSTYVSTVTGSYQHVLDATNGNVLFRRSTVNEARGDALVYDNYPGAARGGDAKKVNFYKRGWLAKTSKKFLSGTSVIAWSDVNDDDRAQNSEKTPVPGTKRRAQFELKAFNNASTLCSAEFICTWKPNKAFSWKDNRRADVTQAFYLASNFHDWLKNGPAKFTKAAGNFTAAGGDPVLLNALDGANSTGDGFPDENHIDNANMNTPPDGTPPTMQMYLWHAPGTTDAEEPFLPTSSAFDASVEYHEYTHGLSNRLVVDAGGVSTLNSIQAGSMGEGWSDYYAMDYLVQKGFVNDSDRPGQVLEGKYLMGGKQPFRTMAADCPVGSNDKNCRDLSGGRGGYTYGDFSSVTDGPEVHASGEIWTQTLWDLRNALGATTALKLITRAMSLSADDPSFLDMRNAILQSDLAGFGGSHQDTIWDVFAGRGMGFFAGATAGADADPAEDFHAPPAAGSPTGTISGTVTDPTSGAPVNGAVVAVAGLDDRYHAVTDANGHYSIEGVFVGTYPKVIAGSPSYFPVVQSVTVTAPGVSADFAIRRDYAASAGGAAIMDFNGPDFTDFGCGPINAIDLSLGAGWGSTTGDDVGTPTNVFVPKFIVVDLGQAVDVTTFGVDPSNTCGDPGSASTGDYLIETSSDAATWTAAAQGTFTAAERGQLNDVTPTAGADNVRYVRFTILGNQTPDFATNCPDGPFAGCTFTDLTELAVFGTPTP